MIFKYTRLDSAFERPYVEITVGHEGSEEAYLTLVDSGADINVFSASLAHDLGINLENGSPLTVRGATGEAETFYMHPVTITVGGVTFETEAAFADIPHLEIAGLAGQRYGECLVSDALSSGIGAADAKITYHTPFTFAVRSY